MHYQIQDNYYHSFILDINDSGAFIETIEDFKVGQPAKLDFFDPFSRRFFNVKSEIIWSKSHAIGVIFYNDFDML